MLYYCIRTITQGRGGILKILNQSTPVFVQVADGIRRDIFGGKYQPGEQIPTVRQLAFDTSVNPNTVQRSLSLLEDEGLIFTKGTVGRFVTEDEGLIKAVRDRVKKEILESLMKEAESLGITRGDIIKFVKEGEAE